MVKKNNEKKVVASSCSQKKKKALVILSLLQKRYPVRETHLEFDNAWELMIATVLAAQCTDARVNKVTPHLFEKWPGPAELAKAEVMEVEGVIRSTGFFRNKAKNIIGNAQRVMAVYGGQVPDTMEDLITLPGVARKTANVVLWGAFHKNVGIAVDTHVGRISYRLGLATGHDPVKTERELMELFPQDLWGDGNHMLVWFGRHVCHARTPDCESCELLPHCEQHGLA